MPKKLENLTRSDIVFRNWYLIIDSYLYEILRTFKVTIYHLSIFPIIKQNWFRPVSRSLQSTGYFGVLCISTSFWVLRTPESWLNYFFQLFSTFFVHLNHFQWFHVWNQQSSSTSFWVRAAPESWLKYTTVRIPSNRAFSWGLGGPQLESHHQLFFFFLFSNFFVSEQCWF